MRQRAIALSGWVVAGIVAVAGMAGPNELRTRRLVVEDADGMERVVIEVKDGVAGMSVYTPDGVMRAKLGVSKPPASEGFLLKASGPARKGGVIVP